MKNYENLLKIYEKSLYETFNYADELQSKIYESMKYSLSSGGKRVRPLLCLLTFLELRDEKSLEDVIPYAVAVELIHTYSLIHDDLPAMDNDNMRRGKPTNHKVYTEGIAILAGDALLNLAVEVISKHIETIDDADQIKRAVRGMRYLFTAAGIQGMIGGQVIDIDLPREKFTKEICENMYRLKTASLIRAAILTGAIVAGADNETVTKLGEFATSIGLAYQYEDDLLDQNSDDSKEEVNMLDFMSPDELKEEIIALTEKGYGAIEDLDLKHHYLRDFSLKLMDRSY
ncbi:MAG: polyprenyl synthetase family protein [Tissierellia bacterium]|nr:polyprenyl synthetase family protein [Tissierellia bacterium]